MQTGTSTQLGGEAANIRPFPTRFPGVFALGQSLYTMARDGSFREWEPKHSKLAAYIKKGGKRVPVERNSRVLYLGAANGTTAGHVADIAQDGTVYCVEVSPRSFRDLVTACGGRRNMLPILANARRPETYGHVVGKVDVVYQDIAQRDQVEIFLTNIGRFLVPGGLGMLMLKSRSVDVSRDPRTVFDEVWRRLGAESGITTLEMVSIGQFQRDHAAFLVRMR